MTRDITRETILRSRLEMAEHNLQCYSTNYLCTVPKDGYEKEFKDAKAEVDILKAWLLEFHSTHIDSTIEFVGHISAISYGKTYDGKTLAERIEFEVETGASFLYGDRRILNLASEVQYWFVDGDTHLGKYDREKDHRSSRLLKLTVDRIMYVRKIEWAEEEDITKDAEKAVVAE